MVKRKESSIYCSLSLSLLLSLSRSLFVTLPPPSHSLSLPSLSLPFDHVCFTPSLHSSSSFLPSSISSRISSSCHTLLVPLSTLPSTFSSPPLTIPLPPSFSPLTIPYPPLLSSFLPFPLSSHQLLSLLHFQLPPLTPFPSLSLTHPYQYCV